MENITKTYSKKEICTHKEDYTRKHMKGKNEVITYINKIFASKHGQRLTYILLYIMDFKHKHTTYITTITKGKGES